MAERVPIKMAREFHQVLLFANCASPRANLHCNQLRAIMSEAAGGWGGERLNQLGPNGELANCGNEQLGLSWRDFLTSIID